LNGGVVTQSETGTQRTSGTFDDPHRAIIKSNVTNLHSRRVIASEKKWLKGVEIDERVGIDRVERLGVRIFAGPHETQADFDQDQ